MWSTRAASYTRRAALRLEEIDARRRKACARTHRLQRKTQRRSGLLHGAKIEGASRRMTISALVLTLDDDPKRREAALERIRARDDVELGHIHGARVPVVTDAADGEEVFEALRKIEGVVMVDVVAIAEDEWIDGMS
jgi:hypothetical protein